MAPIAERALRSDVGGSSFVVPKVPGSLYEHDAACDTANDRASVDAGLDGCALLIVARVIPALLPSAARRLVLRRAAWASSLVGCDERGGWAARVGAWSDAHTLTHMAYLTDGLTDSAIVRPAASLARCMYPARRMARSGVRSNPSAVLHSWHR